MSNLPVVDISGIIRSVGPIEQTTPSSYQQTLLLHNVTSQRAVVSVPLKVSIIVYYKIVSSRGYQRIPFRIDDPISVRGQFTNINLMPYIINTVSPMGYIRYNGVVYR